MNRVEYLNKKNAFMAKGLSEADVVEILGPAPTPFAEYHDGWLTLTFKLDDSCSRMSTTGKTYLHASHNQVLDDIVAESGFPMRVSLTVTSKV